MARQWNQKSVLTNQGCHLYKQIRVDIYKEFIAASKQSEMICLYAARVNMTLTPEPPDLIAESSLVQRLFKELCSSLFLNASNSGRAV